MFRTTGLRQHPWELLAGTSPRAEFWEAAHLDEQSVPAGVVRSFAVLGLVRLLLRTHDCLFAFGEYDRAAYAVATGLMRGVVAMDTVTEALDAEGVAAGEFAGHLQVGAPCRAHHTKKRPRTGPFSRGAP